MNRQDSPGMVPFRESRARCLRAIASLVLLNLATASCCAAARSQPATAVSQPVGAVANPHPGATQAYARWIGDLTDANMEGRGAGTAGLDRARDYLAGHFKGLGLKTPFGESFTQPVEVPLGVKAEKQELAVLDPNGKPVVAAEAGEAFSTLGFSGNGSFSGPAVFVGYGVVSKENSYDSYAGADKDALRGKVAIAFRYEPQDKDGNSLWAGRGGGTWTANAGLVNKAQLAAQHGAVALLIVNPPSQDADKALRSFAQTASLSAAIPAMHISSELFQRILRACGAPDGEAAAGKLQRQADTGKGGMEELRGVTLRGAVKLSAVRGKIHNVAGLLPGAGDLAGQYVIVGAHYDHLGFYEQGGGKDRQRVIYPGADDNASGAAGVMMLAEWFASRAAARDAPVSRRSILFVTFAGEERGLYGSRHLAAYLSEAGIEANQVVAMINLDMIGRLRDDKVTVFGVDSGEGLRRIAGEAADAAKLKANLVAGSFQTSDHAAFYSRRIPVLFFFTGLHFDMHSPRDTADKINPAGAVKVLGMAEATLLRLWADREAPAFTAPKTDEGAGGQRAFLGVTPELGAADGAGGFDIKDVLADSPAAAAGLKAGDRIVRWDDKKIDNVASLLDAVQKGKPGQKVNLKVVRDGQTVDVQVTLGKR